MFRKVSDLIEEMKKDEKFAEAFEEESKRLDRAVRKKEGKRLLNALVNVDLSEDEIKSFKWVMETCDWVTIQNIASVIEKAKSVHHPYYFTGERAERLIDALIESEEMKEKMPPQEETIKARHLTKAEDIQAFIDGTLEWDDEAEE